MNQLFKVIKMKEWIFTTLAKEPDEDDWRKLKHILKYLNGTSCLKLALNMDKLGLIKWYMDASFAIHSDCRGHTGGIMTRERVQLLATHASKSLMGRLTGVDVGRRQLSWHRNFIKAHWYPVKQNILYQDNKSTIMPEQNERCSSSERTRHIKVIHFFLEDKIEKGEDEVQFAPLKRCGHTFQQSLSRVEPSGRLGPS